MRVSALLLLLPGLAFSADCPKPLPKTAYTTRCTGKSAVYQGTIYKDCSPLENPSFRMHDEIPRLIEKVRCEVGDRVKITSAYRSEKHNLYSWAFTAAATGDETIVSKTSKHVLGKAIDFYVEGASFPEHQALESKIKAWAGAFENPVRGSRDRVWTKTYREEEGRDPDNQHASPYLHIELRE